MAALALQDLSRFLPVPLRDYQREAIKTILTWRRSNKRRMVVEMPTGAGKTRTYIGLLQEYLHENDYAVILVPSVSLAQQLYEEIAPWFYPGDVGLLQAEHNQVGRWITVASVHTLAVPHRLAAFLRAYRFRKSGCVLADECHLAPTEKYQTVIDALLHPYGLLVGMTATPYRRDGRSLEHVFTDGLCYYVDILDLVAQGYLVDVEAYQVLTDDPKSLVGLELRINNRLLDLSQLKGPLKEKAWQHNRYVVAHCLWQQLLGEERTLIFADSLSDAYGFYKYFQDQSAPCKLLDGRSSEQTRRKAFEQFHEGDLRVLINYDVLTTGINQKRTKGIIIARNALMSDDPNKGLHMQIIGRGLRPSDERDAAGEPLKTCMKSFYLGSTRYSHVPPVMSTGWLPGSLYDPQSRRIRRKLLEEIYSEEEIMEIEERQTLPDLPPLEINSRIKEVRVAATNLFCGDGWYQDAYGTFTKDMGEQGILIAERESLASYNIFLQHRSGYRNRITSEPMRAPLALGKGLAHVQRKQDQERMRRGERLAQSRLPLTDQQKQHLTNRAKRGGLGLPRNADGSINFTDIKQDKYYRIEALIRELGGKAVSADGKRHVVYYPGSEPSIKPFIRKKSVKKIAGVSKP